MREQKPEGIGREGRDRVVRSLGFADYEEYRRSDLWEGIRRRVLDTRAEGLRERWRGGRKAKRAGKPHRGLRKWGHRKCWCCRRWWTVADVFHEWYSRENLDGRSLEGLRTVCELCTAAAREKDGKPLALDPSADRLLALRSDPRWRVQVDALRKVLATDDHRPPQLSAGAGDLAPELADLKMRQRKAKLRVKKNRQRAARSQLPARVGGSVDGRRPEAGSAARGRKYAPDE